MTDLLCSGVDPGIVHTGVVTLGIAPGAHALYVNHAAIVGPNANAVAGVIDAEEHRMKCGSTTFIEGYKPRHHMSHDKEMLVAVQEMRTVTGGKVIDNMGIKKIVMPKLLEVLGIRKFSTPTHHQDLLSAARILVLGMLKDDDLNKVLADIVMDHLAGNSWRVIDCS